MHAGLVKEGGGALSFGENVGLKFVVLDAATVVLVYNLEEGVDVLALDGDLQFCNQIGHFVDSEVAALVQVEVLENLLKESWVFARQLEDAGLDLSEEVGHGLLGDLRVFLLRHLPG